MKKSLLFLLIILNLISCEVSTKPIDYGNDSCELCKMIVSDKRYGTEIVTKKGKVFTFDSVECLLHFLNQKKIKNSDIFGIYITDFSKPDFLHDATSSFYLLSEKLPSPMGENITAFQNKQIALKQQVKYTGYVLNWKELQKIVKR
ncbi:MAG: nitrous oxide reductase accessory protein NosL [Flavobacteriia bacterium]|nr:nitrous oxide reductase accessory protein NosL [Flavobacteriia bacterium]